MTRDRDHIAEQIAVQHSHTMKIESCYSAVRRPALPLSRSSWGGSESSSKSDFLEVRLAPQLDTRSKPRDEPDQLGAPMHAEFEHGCGELIADGG